MSKISKVPPAGIAVVLGLVLGVAVTGVAVAGVGGNRGQDPAPTYKTNADGLTYGSGLDAISPETEPDLIEAVGTDGTRGYVKSEDLRLPKPKNPEEALARQSRLTDRRIPLYAVDGKTVLGEFLIEAPNGIEQGTSAKISS